MDNQLIFYLNNKGLKNKKKEVFCWVQIKTCCKNTRECLLIELNKTKINIFKF